MANLIKLGGTNRNKIIVFDKMLYNSVFEVITNAQVVNNLIGCYSAANLLNSIYVNPGQRVCVRFSSISANITSGYVGTGNSSTWGVYTILPNVVAGLTFKSPSATVSGRVKIDIVNPTGTSSYIEKIWIE